MRALAINLSVGLALAVAAGIAASAIVRNFDAGATSRCCAYSCSSVAVRAIAIAPMAVLQRTLQFKLQASVLASSMLIAALASIGAAALGAGVWALVVRQLAAAALLPLLAWIVAVKPMSAEFAAPPRARGPLRRKGAVWFFLLAVTDFVALSVDAVVVGHSRGAAELGLYSLAFTLAFAPLTNFAWQIGKVIFPAAAQTAELDVIVRRMLKTTRLTAVALLPLLPPILVLAPVLLPGVLGQEWKSMVVPFQILVAVGVGHAVLVALGDSLSGVGAIAWRARLHVMLGAGDDHRADRARAAGRDQRRCVRAPDCLRSLRPRLRFRGTRRLQTNGRVFAGALRSIAFPIAAQSALTVAVLGLLERTFSAVWTAAVAAACAGLVFVIAVFARFTPVLPANVDARGRLH